MRRLFIACKIDLSSTTRALQQQLHYELQLNDMVWVKEDVTHMTLRFLGKTPEYVLEDLKSTLKEISESHEAFEMSLDKIGVFGSRYKPEVLWLGFHEFSKFQAIFEQLEPALIRLGFEHYRGNFVPHITLARIKGVLDKKKFWQAIQSYQVETPQRIAIRELILYQSFLHADGPEYKVLATFPLRQPE
ncbi:MAG: RNA 2',3'-cyclic phosphodiesterase [Bacteroidales bacterium]|nr:RNA 2',3'-cyclic phosphodiesterase [Bacteroidales bacterium]